MEESFNTQSVFTHLIPGLCLLGKVRCYPQPEEKAIIRSQNTCLGSTEGEG